MTPSGRKDRCWLSAVLAGVAGSCARAREDSPAIPANTNPSRIIPPKRNAGNLNPVPRHVPDRALVHVFGFFSYCFEQRRRQFGIAFLDGKLLALRVYPIQEIA